MVSSLALRQNPQSLALYHDERTLSNFAPKGDLLRLMLDAIMARLELIGLHGEACL